MASEVEEFCAWARTRNVGCYFARAMFKAPEAYGIVLEHLPQASGVALAEAIDHATKTAVENPDCEAVAFVFNRELPLEEYACLLRNVTNKSGWHLREDHVIHEGRDFAIIGADVHVGTEDGVPALSEIVGFAPYDYLPITRRAPVPALVLRTKAAFSLDPLPSRSERRANLAAIRLQIDTNAFNSLWTKSQELRAELDGPNNPMARARVGLAIPATVWSTLTNDSEKRTGNV